MDTLQPKQAPARVQQLHQGEGTKQWTLLSQSKLLSEYSNFIKEKVLSNGHSSAKASSCQSTATSSRRRYYGMDTPQPKQAHARVQQLHQGEGTKQWILLSQSKLLSEYSNFIKEKVLSNGHSSAKASSCQSTATSSRRRY